MTLISTMAIGASSCTEIDKVKIARSGSQASVSGPDSWFSGNVRIDAPFQATEPARVGGATVTFEPQARTAWHTHPLGQTLIVTQGRGWIQEWGKAVREINAGDIIWIPEGVKHWHGATAETGMTHIAIAESLNGSAVEWLEKVDDKQYKGEC
ncbi:germin subfamily 1 member 15 [Leminorella grimontii]|uniref:Germin subfamily 1 member 15 n=1 Tax=Leminorella grimontii TaxID=82981 RepID=A0AAV5MZB1_9GAMM|nr:cupin domain-containing protein [Leminorella grimontii]KFC96163.1 transcriptional regulator [Leminorella grimontii ATCC 33999 = DSM 5078]GKX54650.1 germin subfamily 1 member 15 [Leminorella grimontii]VFS58745.1 Predicted mannose-6-phosphate isomerase [Leminorella grimontii]